MKLRLFCGFAKKRHKIIHLAIKNEKKRTLKGEMIDC